MAELDGPLRPRQVAERVGAEVGKGDVGWELVEDKGFGGAGQQGLAAVAEVA